MSLITSLYSFFSAQMDGGSDSTVKIYEDMKYPRFIPFMKFHTRRAELPDLGSITLMRTTAMGGAMQLLTAAFTPNTGKSLPFLLVDCMEMKKKSLAYVEYYDCTGRSLRLESLEQIAAKYAAVPDYAETPAWYVSERMAGSMIKGGAGADAELLAGLVRESAEEYLRCAAAAQTDPGNLQGLKAFQDRMVNEGNPSTATMTKVLGAQGAEDFFRNYIMPVPALQRKTVNVVAAVICDRPVHPTQIFATARGYGDYKGWWEFPGGKVEAGETPEDALAREIREELDSEIEVGAYIDTIEYDYPKFHLSMRCYYCSLISGSLTLREAEAAKWLTKDDIDSVNWLPADVTLIGRIREDMGEKA